MEQKDINKLLICRAAIDKHRAFNRARVEALATSKSVDEAKSIIESKIGIATTISSDRSAKTPQDIKYILEDERTKLTLVMNAILKEQGFYQDYEFGKDIGSASVFFDFNTKMNEEESLNKEPRFDVKWGSL